MEKKKNSKYYIIPASYFKSKGISPIPVDLSNTKISPKTTPNQNQEEDQVIIDTAKDEPITTEAARPVLDLKKDNRTSGLSLKSIRAKKEHQIRQMDVVIDTEDLPTETFTEAQFHETWNTYIAQLHKKGEKIMASILEMGKPNLKGTDIQLEFPNDTLRVELERAQYPLMDFLRKSLLNYDLKLDINVNEEIAKKYAFTAQEKYQKLKEKNPNIEVLKKTFGLDI